MNTDSQPKFAYELDETQDILLTLARCAECADAACVNNCPGHIDLRAALRAAIRRVPELARQGDLIEGVTYAERAIEECYN